MSTDFAKYEGAGNDFILIDDRDQKFPIKNKSLIQHLSNRHFGIGADGIILLQNDLVADFRMRVLNSDGSEAQGCGNGLRCLMRFIADLGLEPKKYRIAAGQRILSSDFRGDRIGVEMGEMKNFQSHLIIDQMDVHFVDSGVPHVVWFVESVDAVSLQTVGPFLRRHPRFAPDGVNVNIACMQKDGIVRVRTYERGVEGETLSCGTGATAVAFIGSKLFNWPSPITIRFQGGDLEIHLATTVWMVGPAKKVFSGKIG